MIFRLLSAEELSTRSIQIIWRSCGCSRTQQSQNARPSIRFFHGPPDREESHERSKGIPVILQANG